MWLWVAAVVAVGFWALRVLWYRWNYDLHKVPSPKGVPFFGQSFYFARGSHATTVDSRILQWRKELGNPKLMKLKLKGKNHLVLMDGACMRSVVHAKPGGLPKSPDVTKDWVQVMSGDASHVPFFAVPTTTPYVKLVRRALGRCMTIPAMKKSLPQLRRVLGRLMQILDVEGSKGSVDVEDLFTKTMLDCIGEFAFDVDLGGLNGSSVCYESMQTCGHHMRNLNLKPLLKLKLKLFPSCQEAQVVKRDLKKLIGVWHNIAAEIQKREPSLDADGKMWAALKSLRHPDTEELLSIELLRGEVATMIIGGTDTTGHTLAWTIALLATYPSVTEKIIDELKTHGLYGKSWLELEFEDLAELQYLTAAVKESMRRAHVALFAGRKYFDRDMEILGYRIPKGTYLSVGSNVVSHVGCEWDEPLAFRPERWLGSPDLSDKYYFPFSGGERDCLGQRFAMNIMRLTIATFVSSFSFQLANGETFESLFDKRVAGLTATSKSGIWVYVKKRNNTATT